MLSECQPLWYSKNEDVPLISYFPLSKMICFVTQALQFQHIFAFFGVTTFSVKYTPSYSTDGFWMTCVFSVTDVFSSVWTTKAGKTFFDQCKNNHQLKHHHSQPAIKKRSWGCLAQEDLEGGLPWYFTPFKVLNKNNLLFALVMKVKKSTDNCFKHGSVCVCRTAPFFL